MSKNWLPHLSVEVISETEGNYLDAYVVALEGWRRGLTLKWHIKDSEKFKDLKTWYVEDPGQLFSLHSDKQSHYFFRTRGDKVSNEAVQQGMDKAASKQGLQAAGVPVPEGKQFTAPTEDAVIAYANEIGFPVVIKPVNGSFGRGVVTNITSEGELTYALDYLKNELKETDIIVEKHITGKDYRLYVVDDQVHGAILRMPPNVVGDGINSIEALIDIKNAEREFNPRLISYPIRLNDETKEFIIKAGHQLDTVPAEGEVIYLSSKCNVSIGGDPIDVLDELSEEVKATAVRALQSIPGLVHGAVDIMVETDANGNEQSFVLELNPTAQLGGLLFPVAGKSRDIPSAIIDYYFPETKEVYTEKEKVYFDFYEVLEPLISRQAESATVTPAPLGKIFMKKYIVYGDVQDFGYHQGLRKQAFERGLQGYVMSISEEAIEIVVAGIDAEMVEDFKNGIIEDEERATVIEIKEEDYHSYVKVGFNSKVNLQTIQEELEILRADMEVAQQELQKLEKQKRKLQKSMSWKVTSPIRVAGAIVKTFKR